MSAMTVVRPKEKRLDGAVAAANLAIRSSPYAEIRRGVKCVAVNGALGLRGAVSTYFLKQSAQELIRNVCGENDFVNDIRVSGNPKAVAGVR